MLDNLLKGVFGSRNARVISRLSSDVKRINQLEEEIASLTDEQLREKFSLLREEHMQGTELNKLLPEAFAVVREGGKRVLGMRHFDAQLLGGLILHQGNIAEMRTGEGKTLVATLPAYLHALSNKGVHIVTVNDYLAKRDSQWMGKLFTALGLSVGVIYSGQPQEERRAAYAADITYGTNNEFGFDYLRDNLTPRVENRVQRGTHFALVDEVDSILIDEARTPLIISGPRDESPEIYRKLNKLIPTMEPEIRDEAGEILQPGDFHLDEKTGSIELTDPGYEKMEKLLTQASLLKEGESLYDSASLYLLHHVQAELKAHHVYKRDVAYLIQNGQIVIVDEHTGRALPGRRWSDGIHQAVEAKEGLEVQRDNQTLASITFQNYFRLYDILAGMTGTADTEAYEFQQIYELEVVVIPTHKPMIRNDQNDLVFMTAEEKFTAISKDIEECVAQKRPVLVGTTSVEASEKLSAHLKRKNIPHEVLNAKNHEREAAIIASAGKTGMITISTNMAGRGTDIVLGGNIEKELNDLPEDAPESQRASIRADWQERHDLVIERGGLHIIGSERHESRRIDNQLRGRAGRQGDPGSSRFYLSMEDSLMRIFASERVASMMKSLGLPKGEPIEHSMVTKAVERAQRKVEGRNFDIRKQLLEYDDVANSQRLIIYDQRNRLLEMDNPSEIIRSNLLEQVELQTLVHIPEHGDTKDSALLAKLFEHVHRNFHYDPSGDDALKDMSVEKLSKVLPEKVYAAYQEKYKDVPENVVCDLEKQVMLQVIDTLWREHLQTMEYIRQGIHLRGYAQRNPKEEYKRESYVGFEQLLNRIKADTVKLLCNIRINESPSLSDATAPRLRASAPDENKMVGSHESASPMLGLNAPEQSTALQRKVSTYTRSGPKVGRNQPCPCGSGKKYKHCHGKDG